MELTSKTTDELLAISAECLAQKTRLEDRLKVVPQTREEYNELERLTNQAKDIAAEWKRRVPDS